MYWRFLEKLKDYGFIQCIQDIKKNIKNSIQNVRKYKPLYAYKDKNFILKISIEKIKVEL